MRHDAKGVFWCAMRMRGVNHTQRGSVYVIALLTLMVLGTLASMLGWSALVQAQRAYQRETRLRLESLCQSGIHYASWARRIKGRPLPFTERLNLSEGTVIVQARSANQYGRNAFEVISTAFYKDQTLTRTRILEGNDRPRQATEFALYVDDEITVEAGKKIRVKGDVHTNRTVRVVQGGQLEVDGSLTATNQISGSPTATVYTEAFSKEVPFDLPDPAVLRSQATQLVVGNINLPFGLSLADGSIYYVAGDLTLQGTLRGSATVVVKGNLILNDDIEYDNDDTLFIFIVNGNIKMAPGKEVEGMLISRNGDVIAGDGSKIYGGIYISNGALLPMGELRIEHDPRINTDLFRQFFKSSTD